jgi:hypothetical protein
MRRTAHKMLETVESRRLLSGNVAVAFDGQQLEVVGDNLGNNVVISQSLAGAITVSGQNGTLINGLPSVRFAQGLGLEKFDVRMEGGEDRVTINRVNVAGDLNVDLGLNVAGRDTLSISNSTFQGNVFAYGGRDLDTINMTGSTVFGDAIIDLAEGSGRSTLNASTIQGSLTLVGGEGADVFNSNGLTVGLALNVDAKQGNDVVNYANGSAQIANFNMDAGADRVTVSNYSTMEDFNVDAGDQNDIVTLTGIASSKNLLVNLGSGNDVFSVSGSSAAEDVVVIGGAGTDRITDRGLTGGIKKEVLEFEVIA